MIADSRNTLIGRHFDRAATRYDSHAAIQRQAAGQLAERIARLPLPPNPRILEIGCGTGMLTQALAQRLGAARWTVTDISPQMLAVAQTGLALPGHASFLQMDGEFPALEPGSFDLICSSLAMQWFGNLNAGLARLSRLLAPGGHLAIATLADGTFREWRRAHRELGLRAATPRYPLPTAINPARPDMQGGVHTQELIERHRDGREFLHRLKAIGAGMPAAGTRPLGVPALRRVLAHFDQQGASVSYNVAYGTWQKTSGLPRGVFVTGTDTGIGKTLVSAVLAVAWDADYWKPLQTGVAEEPGDTETIARLTGFAADRLRAPAHVLQAPLSPWAAAPLENAVVDASAITFAASTRTCVVEGAGGLLVPIDDQHMMIDLIAQLGLPVVLAARSSLGTINHTLLSLEALRQRGIAVLGVVMSGVPSAGNRTAIERFGQVRVLAEIPQLDQVDARAVARIAQGIPTLQDCVDGMI
jgi:malonyl-CoA O-methyltransferase